MQAPCVVRSSKVFILFIYFFWDFLGTSWHFGRMGVQYPHFLKLALPLHLEVLNVPFLMEIGDFIVFQILFFLNLEYTWTFISIVGIFVS
jgi:hypothetical protein